MLLVIQLYSKKKKNIFFFRLLNLIKMNKSHASELSIPATRQRRWMRRAPLFHFFIIWYFYLVFLWWWLWFFSLSFSVRSIKRKWKRERKSMITVKFLGSGGEGGRQRRRGVSHHQLVLLPAGVVQPVLHGLGATCRLWWFRRCAAASRSAKPQLMTSYKQTTREKEKEKN